MPLSEYAAALRILDANANRASEGLRVVEDYCRFALNDEHLARRCKELRHRLQQALLALQLEERLSLRDAAGDVGARVTIDTEKDRQTLTEVAAASWSRVEQALRAIEEYGKLVAADLASAAKELRYEAYTLAKASAVMAFSQERLREARLYVLINGADSLATFELRAKQLVSAGVHVLQLRDKRLDDRELLRRAKALRAVTKQTATLFIMNDRPDLALLSQADGVHVGQEELSVAEVRQIVGPTLLVGVSTHNLAQARQAVLDGANYLGCGPTFPSSTKQFEQFAGLEFLRQVAAEISLPAFAIGGIGLEQLDAVLAAGISRIAVSSAIPSDSVAPTIVRQFLDRLA